MFFNKIIPIAACLSLLTSCGGGSSSSSTNTPDTSPNTTNIISVNQGPTAFFSLDTIERANLNFNSTISFEELIDTQLVNIVESEGESRTHFFYGSDNNLSESFVEDETGSVTSQTFYSYTFNNGQVVNLETERIFFDDDSSILQELFSDIEWVNGIPQSIKFIASRSGLFVNGEPVPSENNFVYETDASGQVIRTFEVVNGENVLFNESQFSTIDDDFISIGDESINTVFDTSNNDTRQQSFFSYDDDENTVVVINEFFESNIITSSTIDFIIHDSETNQTVVLIVDLDDFNNDAIDNITVFNYSYFETSSCGSYHVMERFAFNSLIPTCINNLTYSN